MMGQGSKAALRESEIPLFPLMTVLFPGGPLPLRIFEPRYLDMVSLCLRESRPFGVVLISEGKETGESSTCDLGTTAAITDWYQGSDGLLGVTALGQQIFRVLESRRQADGLNIGRVELMPAQARTPLAESDRGLGTILERVLDQLGAHYQAIAKDYADAGWVSYRLAEVLPISLELKQRCLATPVAEERLALLRPVLDKLKLD